MTAWQSRFQSELHEASVVGVRSLTAIAARLRGEQDYRGFERSTVVGAKVVGSDDLRASATGESELPAGTITPLVLREACNAFAHQDRLRWGFRIDDTTHFVLLGVPALGRFAPFSAEIDVMRFADAAENSGIF